MAILCPPDRFSRLAPLAAELHPGIPLLAILQHCSPGWACVDDLDRPTAALVGSPWGYFYLLGRADTPAFDQTARALLFDEWLPRLVAAGERGMILYPAPGERHAQLQTLLEGRQPARIFRRTFTFDPAAFRPVPPPPDEPPQPIDAALLRAHPALAAEIAGSWTSTAAFLEQGLGFVQFAGADIASLCYAAFAADGNLELSVRTAPAFRGQGWATRVSAACIAAALERGQRPVWECFWNNTPSTALAHRLGFIPGPDHPVYYWEEPI